MMNPLTQSEVTCMLPVEDMALARRFDEEQPGLDPSLKTVEHAGILGSEKAAWFEDTEGNIPCLHEDLG